MKQFGSCPVNRLFDRSRKLKALPTILHIREIGPENKLLERINEAVLKGKAGSRPSNRLKLKSNPGNVSSTASTDEKSGSVPLIKL
jgi:hypothetical protein